MIEELKKIGLEARENVALRDYTTFKIGGPAKFFVVVNNKANLFKALQAAKKFNLPFFILGGGSNVLIADRGFNGLVIKLQEGEVKFKGNQITVFAGNNWAGFVRKTIEAGFGGLEFGANIPGTVGGAVFGNAGAYGKGAGDFVESAEAIIVDDEVRLKIFDKEECQFAYRESIFKKHKDWIIAELAFKLEKDEKAAEKLVQIQREYSERRAKQPLDFPSAGSSFKNVLYSDELSPFKEWQQYGKIPAARFIEEAGLKGAKIGGAMVSGKHANFVVNAGGASADDVARLIDLVKTKVREKFGVQLEEEVQLIGFRNR
ncbi:UDP-N-acetylmuramate dehydrogenase [Candidatus Falkowbacteria bacterium]|nr:UDP-N-acetylmuramate dehydrogenase [Candidatus Falkowbacteria bacterium]